MEELDFGHYRTLNQELYLTLGGWAALTPAYVVSHGVLTGGAYLLEQLGVKYMKFRQEMDQTFTLGPLFKGTVSMSCGALQ